MAVVPLVEIMTDARFGTGLKKTLHVFGGACLLLCLSGCSAAVEDLPPAPAGVLRAEIYLARASLFKAEFEQFKVSANRVYSECGEIRRGRPVPFSQEFVSLDSALADSLQQQLSSVYAALNRQKPDLPGPGKAEGFADPGQVILSIESENGRVEARTSVDETSAAGGGELLQIRRFAVSVRKLVADALGRRALCGNSEFYGIGSR